MSTVQALVNEFCDRINQPREATLVGSSTPAARQYLSLFRFIADELLDYQAGWSQLKRVYSFTTTTDIANYQLPGDYLRMLTGTQWGVTTQLPLAGPLSSAQLAFQTYGVSIATPFAGYQVNSAQGYIFNTSPYTQRSAGYFQLSPPGQNSTDVNVIAYTSCNYVWPTDWVASTPGYVVGSKVTGINNIYIATAITTGTSGTTRPSITTGTVVDGGVTWTPYHEPYDITADTDIFLLPKELMIEGLRWAWYQAKKQSYADLEMRWRGKVRTALGAANGAGEINAGFNVNDQTEWPNTPVGSWPGTGGT
jgi:hypothetical protein